MPDNIIINSQMHQYNTKCRYYPMMQRRNRSIYNRCVYVSCQLCGKAKIIYNFWKLHSMYHQNTNVPSNTNNEHHQNNLPTLITHSLLYIDYTYGVLKNYVVFICERNQISIYLYIINIDILLVIAFLRKRINVTMKKKLRPH